MDRKSLSVIGIFILLIAATIATILYAQGYRLDLEKRALLGTGILLVKSTPDGSKIFIDGKFHGVTNTPISLKEGTFNIKIERDGYMGWEKEVPVKSGFVTTIDALLPPLFPELKPLTASGTKLPTLSNSQKEIAYISHSEDKDGIWILNLESPGAIGVLRSRTTLAALDGTITYSNASAITWSAEDRQLLVQISNKLYLIDLDLPPTQTPEIITDKEKLLISWGEETKKTRNKLVERINFDADEIKEAALSPSTLWSPNLTKFLYVKDGAYHVFNTTKILEVGESRDVTLPPTLTPPTSPTSPTSPKIKWLFDSRHFILLSAEGGQEASTVSIMDMDGTNKRDLFSGNLMGGIAFSTPDASKVVVLTSFNPASSPNLYTINLR